MIGDDVVVTILQVREGPVRPVRIGFDAPESVTIFREEVYQRIVAAKGIQGSGAQ